jgi:mono/diheme cytochrome c family protein
MSTHNIHRGWTVFGLVLLAACSKEPAPAVPAVSMRNFEPASVARGAALFEQNCAQCHGPQAQGHPDWQTPSSGEFSAAPPLNGSGNDWKRTRAELAATVRNGVRRKTDKVDVMPSWKGRLSDRDIEDMVNWMQSLWPAEVYEAWTRAQTAAPAPKS